MKSEMYGNFIKERRKKLNMSQGDLGDLLHCSFQAISRYEANIVNIDLSFLGILARSLSVDLTSFIEAKELKLNDDCDYLVFDADRFSATLIYLRDDRKLSQKDMSKKLGFSNNKISKWENGTSLPTISEFVKLTEFFNVSYEDLYFAKFDIVDNTPKQYKKKRLFTLSLSSQTI